MLSTAASTMAVQTTDEPIPTTSEETGAPSSPRYVHSFLETNEVIARVVHTTTTPSTTPHLILSNPQEDCPNPLHSKNPPTPNIQRFDLNQDWGGEGLASDFEKITANTTPELLPSSPISPKTVLDHLTETCAHSGQEPTNVGTSQTTTSVATVLQNPPQRNPGNSQKH